MQNTTVQESPSAGRFYNPRLILQNVMHDLEDSDTESGAAEAIEHFKYKQELSRKLTINSVLGLSVSIMSVPLGISTTMIVGLLNGGGVTIFWGWVIVCLLSLIVTSSLSEMSGKYPTNGGVYHWSYIFAPRSIKRFTRVNYLTSWYVGWCLIIGNLTMGMSIMFSGAQFFLSIFGIADTTYHPHSYITLLVYVLLVVICGLINLKCYNFLDTINKVSIHWTIYTVLIIDALLLLFSHEFNDLFKVLTTFEKPRSGWPGALAFLIGLQQSAFTFQGYGMIPSMTDEVETPEKIIPKGMILSVIVAGVTGIIFILPILACTPELDVLLDVEANILPIELIFKASSQSLIISFLFVILLCGTIFFGSIGIFTISSRSIYSLARDNGLPYSHSWTHVGSDANANKIPNNAIYLTGGWLMVMGSFTLISSSVLYSFMGTSVVSLALSNFVPIILSMINKRRKLKGSPFRIKKAFGYLFNFISLVWCLMMTFIFSCPIQAHVTTYTMNYTSLIVTIELIVITLLWFIFGRKKFQGPELDESFTIEMNTRQATYSRLGTAPEVPNVEALQNSNIAVEVETEANNDVNERDRFDATYSTKQMDNSRQTLAKNLPLNGSTVHDEDVVNLLGGTPDLLENTPTTDEIASGAAASGKFDLDIESIDENGDDGNGASLLVNNDKQK